MTISKEQEQLIVKENLSKIVYKTDFAKQFVKGMFMFDVTNKAKNVLGEELVKSAWLNIKNVMKDESESITLSNIERNDAYKLFYLSEVEDDDNLHIPFEADVFITLTTGKVLRLWTSEWGGLE